jgi:transposase
MSTGKRNSYDKQFKLSAVKMIVEGGMRVSQVSRDLGINENSLHKWKRDYLSDQQNAFPGKGKMKPEDEEFRRIEKELRRVQMENEILKKAIGYFTKVQE